MNYNIPIPLAYGTKVITSMRDLLLGLLQAHRTKLVMVITFCCLPSLCLGEQIHRELEFGSSKTALNMMLQSPALIFSRDEMLQTPLHVATSSKHVEVVRWLLVNGAEANAQAYNGFTPLHVCCSGEIARLLIENRANLDQVDNWGRTPLQHAVFTDQKDVVNTILASGYRADIISAVKLRMRNRVNEIIRENSTMFWRANVYHAMTKNTCGVISNWGCETPLGIAADQGDRELVELFLDIGADVDEGTYMPFACGKATALTNAVKSGHQDIVELLLSRGASVNVSGGNRFHGILDYARKHSTPQIVMLLEREWPAKRSSGFSQTPSNLFVAALSFVCAFIFWVHRVLVWVKSSVI